MGLFKSNAMKGKAEKLAVGDKLLEVSFQMSNYSYIYLILPRYCQTIPSHGIAQAIC
jgi:hypothetical protein